MTTPGQTSPDLEDPRFHIERLFHNGLPRYGSPAHKDLDLGTVTIHGGTPQISTDLTDIDSAPDLLASGDLNTPAGNPNKFARFLQAAVDANDAGRLGRMERLYRRRLGQSPPTLHGLGSDITIEVLTPVPTIDTGPVRLPAFANPDSSGTTPSASHTVNGNSVVLRLTYGTRRFVFGGDLNHPAQTYLLNRYHQHPGEFAADVNKACHHGSSDFSLGWLMEVNPHATVFSSGDDGTYDHPMPDSMGGAARHSRGQLPLVFSTELAREGPRHLGHINARSNGTDLVMAQKKEKPSTKTTWHTFLVPYQGRP